MIEFDVRWLDVKPNLASGVLPVYLLERPLMHNQPKAWAGPSEVAREGTYHVPQLAAFGDNPMWVVTAAGPVVRVPVHAYRTNVRSLATIWAVGLQVGLALVDSFRSHNREPIKQIVLVLGEDCTDLVTEGHDAFRAYAGVAIKT